MKSVPSGLMAYYILKSYKLNFPAFKAFEVLSQEKNCFFLDSSLNHKYLGRYSFLGIEPFFILKTKGINPFKAIRENLGAYKVSFPDTGIPFLGGAVGYLAYDLGFVLQKSIKKKSKPDAGIPDCRFGFYNTSVIIDHHKHLFYILSLGFPEKKYHLAKTLAESNFKKIYNLLSKITLSRKDRPSYTFNPERVDPPIHLKEGSKGRALAGLKKRESHKLGIEELSSNFSKTEYLGAVKTAKEYIRNGDIYQVNLAQTFTARSRLSAFQIYRRLRQISPSYFGAYLDTGDFQIISSSPERFLRLEGDIVTTQPMKGTRPRSKNRLQDRKFEQELLKSPKDKAELMMIVDLERNDLGRVCSYASIRVPVLRQLEQYRTVFQTTATISGRLHKNKDRCDLLAACFPGGSITGCPKIRAMEIIEELEPTRRAIYTGCLGYLSFSGQMDFNILIRTILKKQDTLYFAAGGGIVADSQPFEEYQETLVKARAMIEAIKIQERNNEL